MLSRRTYSKLLVQGVSQDLPVTGEYRSNLQDACSFLFRHEYGNNPTQFDRRSRHSIVGKDDHGNEVVLPLLLRGVVSHIPTHYPIE